MAIDNHIRENLLELLPSYYDELHNLSNLQDVEIYYNDTKVFIKYILEDVTYIISLLVNTDKSNIFRQTEKGFVGNHTVILKDKVVKNLVADIYSSMSSEIYNNFTNSAKFGNCYYFYNLISGGKLVQSTLPDLLDTSKNT